MTGHGGRRTQAERDAITVEIGYALFSAALAAALLFGVVAGPALLFALPETVEKVLLRVGLTVTPVVFVARVVSVLLRFRAGVTGGRTDTPSGHADATAGDGDATAGHADTPSGHADREAGPLGAQPSQPGLTSPDS
ncbi:DUF6332 family protein [Streptomyces sp. NPDC006259]|uniref:DUF6332 family protein n=1 Tax=Streptomyces sp. NPDC006259 TaxID=3364740 RepID=UPI00369CC8C8